MDNTPAAFLSDDLSNENVVFKADPTRHIKTETASDNKHQIDNKPNINVEENVYDVSLQNERKYFSKNNGTDMTTSNSGFELESKLSIKEEPIVSDTELPNVEYLDCLNLGANLKNEPIKGSDYKMGSKLEPGIQEFVSDTISQKIKKESDFSTYTAIETETKRKIDSLYKESLVTDIFNADTNQESDSHSEQDKGHRSSELPRFTLEATLHNIAGAAIVTACGKNVDVRPNICSHMCHPVCSIEHFEANSDDVCKPKLKIDEKSSNNQCVSNEHLMALLKQNSYKCDICLRSFTQKSSLNRHNLLHSGTKQYDCECCDKSFIQKSNLEAHKLIHSGKKPYQCEHCEKCFSLKSHLQRHILLHSGTKPYKCDHCGKSFTQKVYFEAHKLFHSGTKPYKCEQCDKHYTLKTSLNKHTLLHSGSIPYRCEHCGKSFTQKTYFEKHKLFHSGSKPYKCEHCDKSFTYRSNLNTHILLHSGTKEYKCEHCDKCFTQKSNLQRHKLFHLGTKPYQCKHCDKSFTRKSALNRHGLVHPCTK